MSMTAAWTRTQREEAAVPGVGAGVDVDLDSQDVALVSPGEEQLLDEALY
jgi:hypothetical protein